MLITKLRRLIDMKIAMPKNGEMINQHFGKSESFEIITLVEGNIIDTNEVSATSLAHNHGGLVNLLLSSGVSLVITGGIGGGMYNALQDQGLRVIRGASGKIEDIIKDYIFGKLEDIENCCNHHGPHHSHR
jgi:predicted Fe-Mo cluster-binding NifX family protein